MKTHFESRSKEIPDDTSGNNIKRKKLPTRKRTRHYIPWSKFDHMSSMTFLKIKHDEYDTVRGSVRIPAPYYADVKTLLALKRQTFQEFMWSLILENMATLEQQGYFKPNVKPMLPDEPL